MRSLRARARLLVGIVLLAVLIGGVGVLATLNALRLIDDLADEAITPIQIGTADLRAAALSQETGLEGYVATGQELLLLAYGTGGANADAQLATLNELAADPGWVNLEGTDPAAIPTALDEVEASLAAWRTDHAEPQIAATRAGQQVPPGKVVAEAAAFAQVRADLAALDRATDDAFAAAQDARDDALRRLTRATLAAAAGLLLAAGLLIWLLRRWITQPIASLSGQMAQVADGDLDRPLTPAGPTEIAAMGANAERMRARLLHDVDEAVRAREAIAQQSPLVAGLRAELDRPGAPAPGWDVAGQVVPAEGVLAGDWWVVATRPDAPPTLLLADIAGHGVGPGLGALRLREALLALLADGRALDEALAAACARFSGEELATLLAVELPADGEPVRWASAGHPSAWLCSPDAAVELAVTGPLLSALGGRWSVRSAPWPAGAVLVCATDGALESRDGSGADLGPAGWSATAAEAVRAAQSGGSQGILERLQAAVRTHTGDRSPDDVTVVVARRA